MIGRRNSAARARHAPIACDPLLFNKTSISAAASGPYYYSPGYYYGPGPVYYRPHCYWTRQRVWDGYGWYVRRVRVCD